MKGAVDKDINQFVKLKDWGGKRLMRLSSRTICSQLSALKSSISKTVVAMPRIPWWRGIPHTRPELESGPTTPLPFCSTSKSLAQPTRVDRYGGFSSSSFRCKRPCVLFEGELAVHD